MANDIKYGTKAIIDMLYGNKHVKELYYGNKLIWPSVTYVKYHFRFSWGHNDNIAFYEFFLDGTPASSRLVDGGRYQAPEWRNVDSSIIASLQNPSSDQATYVYGSIVELNFVASGLTTMAYTTPRYGIGINSYTTEIIGEDANGNRTTIITVNQTIAQDKKYTFNLLTHEVTEESVIY